MAQPTPQTDWPPENPEQAQRRKVMDVVGASGPLDEMVGNVAGVRDLPRKLSLMRRMDQARNTAAQQRPPSHSLAPARKAGRRARVAGR